MERLSPCVSLGPHYAVATHMPVIALDFCRAHGCQTSLFDAPDPNRDTVAAV
jgi:hypothetical protein